MGKIGLILLFYAYTASGQKYKSVKNSLSDTFVLSNLKNKTTDTIVTSHIQQMKLKEIELTDNNHFVAMEYYFFILNRTFLIVKTQGYLVGIEGNGLISVESGGNILAREIASNMAVKGDLTNPYSYLKNSYIEKVENVDLLDGSLTKLNNTNFVIKISDIKNAQYNPKKKWGMGYYPHDGRVTIETFDNQKREFIVLGNQSGQKIASWILIN